MARFYIVDRNDRDAMSAVRKMTDAKPGMFVMLTAGEFDAVRDRMMSIEFDPPTQKGEADDRSDSGEPPV